MIKVTTTLHGIVSVTHAEIIVTGEQPMPVVMFAIGSSNYALSLVEAESIALALQSTVHTAMNPEVQP
jgi:hypothetical protein